MSFQLIHNSVLHIHRNIGLTGKLEEVKKKERNRATSCYIVSRHASQISILQ